MSEKIITTKQELKKALENKEKIIIVEGELANNLEKVLELKKVSKPVFFATLGAVTVGGGVGMILGPAGAAGGATVGAAAVAATMSVSTVSVVAAFSLIAILGVSLLWSVTHDYCCDFEFNPNVDIEAGDFKVKVNPKVILKRQKEK